MIKFTQLLLKWKNSINYRLLSKKTQKEYKLLIVGGGTGGVAIASKFTKGLRSKGERVAIIEPNELHYYQSMFTLVGGGIKKFNQTFKLTQDVIPTDCHWIRDRVVKFDPDNNRVIVADSSEIKYEYLLMATGLQLNYNKIPGLLDALQLDPMVCSIYSPLFVHKVLPAMNSVTEGNAIFTFPETPVKCAGAGQKICYLSEERMHNAGKRNKVTVSYNTALPVIFPVPHYAEALDKYASSRNIEVNKEHKLISVNHLKRELAFQVGSSPENQLIKKYSVLHVTPPMSTTSELWNSPLVDSANFVRVNRDTLQHDTYANVFAIGDCTNTPTSKTAAACASQIGVVSANLWAVMKGKKLPQKYDGYTSCPLTVSSSKVILAEFGYDQKILETFPIDQRVPRRSMFILKAHFMPQIYWLLMIKGWWHGPSFFRKITQFGS